MNGVDAGISGLLFLIMANRIKKLDSNYTQVPNDLLNHKEISLKAKGLFCFMNSKSDDWNFTISSMAKQLKEDDRAIMSGLKELKEYGWLCYKKNNDGSGDYILKYPNCQNPNVQNSSLLKQQSINNKDIYNNKDIINNRMSEISFSLDKLEFYVKSKSKTIIIPTDKKTIEYFKAAEAFRLLFIENLEDEKSPITHQKNATFKNYVNPIRLIFEKEKVSHEKLNEVYFFIKSKDGDFWKMNILSTKKLREKIATLIMQQGLAEKKNRSNNNFSNNPGI